MHLSSRFIRGLLVLAAVTGLVLLPTAAQADPSFYEGPLFGLTKTPDGGLVVADYGKGLVNGDTGALVAALPQVQDVAPRGHGKFWAVTAGFPQTVSDNQSLYRVDGGVVTKVADLFAFEAANNPHPGSGIESNPYGVVDLGGGKALVVDAAGNDLLRIDKHGRIELVAVFPDELVSTDNAKRIAGCPHGPPGICGLPPMIPTESVPTSVVIGPDGAYYVGELKGFPGPIGESKVWRIDPHAKGVRCGESPQCTVVLDGFTSIIDVVFKGNKLYVAQLDDASFFALEFGDGSKAEGGSVYACNLSTKACQVVVGGVPILAAVTFRGAHLWGTILALVPGAADAVPLN